jgi:hypothetical protein
MQCRWVELSQLLLQLVLANKMHLTQASFAITLSLLLQTGLDCTDVMWGTAV